MDEFQKDLSAAIAHITTDTKHELAKTPIPKEELTSTQQIMCKGYEIPQHPVEKLRVKGDQLCGACYERRRRIVNGKTTKPGGFDTTEYISDNKLRTYSINQIDKLNMSPFVKGAIVKKKLDLEWTPESFNQTDKDQLKKENEVLLNFIRINGNMDQLATYLAAHNANNV